MAKDDLYNKVKNAEPDIAFCDWKECKDRGQYMRCYFDLFKLCPIHITHRNYLKTIREMKANRKYKIRHHPRRE